MFKKLTDFGYARSGKEVFGFYIGYLILIMLGGAVLGAIFAVVSSDDSFETGLRVGAIVSVLSAVTLSFLIIQAKNKLTLLNLALSLVAGLLASLGGGLLGLIIPTYFSTQGKKKNGKK